MNAGDIVTAALQDLGVLAANETPTAADATLGLARLNRLMGQYRSERLTVPAIARTTWTITPSIGTYTVATSGADITASRPASPNNIQGVAVLDSGVSPSLEIQLTPLTEDGYENIAQKSLTAYYPTNWYYSPTYPLGTLILWMAPTCTTLSGVLYGPNLLENFSALSTSFILPDGYERFLTTALAMELSPAFQVPPSPALVQAATESRAAVMRANQRLSDLSVDPGALIMRDRRYGWSALVGP